MKGLRGLIFFKIFFLFLEGHIEFYREKTQIFYKIASDTFGKKLILCIIIQVF